MTVLTLLLGVPYTTVDQAHLVRTLKVSRYPFQRAYVYNPGDIAYRVYFFPQSSLKFLALMSSLQLVSCHH